MGIKTQETKTPEDEFLLFPQKIPLPSGPVPNSVLVLSFACGSCGESLFGDPFFKDVVCPFNCWLREKIGRVVGEGDQVSGFPKQYGDALSQLQLDELKHHCCCSWSCTVEEQSLGQCQNHPVENHQG